MESTKIGKAEAIALLITVIVNHTLLNGAKSIIVNSHSSAILNVIYISFIAIVISYIFYKLLNKFPTFDILDISNLLGGKVLKFIVGVIFFLHFLLISSTLLKNFAFSLQTIYYPYTDVSFIVLLFLIAAVLVCTLKYNAIFRSNLIIIPMVILSLFFLFWANIRNYSFTNIFPIIGNGFNETFLLGTSNLFAFQGLLYLLFLPPYLKNPAELKKITLGAVLFSSLCILSAVSTVLLLFDKSVSNEALMPLYSAVRYIEFGTFFQRLDSVFLLIWIISFVSYLGITIKISYNILRKVTSIARNEKTIVFIISIIIFVITLILKNHAISSFLIESVYKYISLIILTLSFALMAITFCYKNIKTKLQTLLRKGGI